MNTTEIFNALAYIVGGGVFLWAARTRGLATEGIWRVVLVGLICGTIGAKLTQLVAQGWPMRVDAAVALDPRNGGRALLGGLIFGWVGVEVAKRRLGIRRSTGDLFALALPAGEAVGRIGCYLGGCCYGKECDLPWAILQHGAMRHPTQLYSAATAALIFFVLLAVKLWKGVSLAEGALFRLYLALFAVSRFTIEFFRAQDSTYFGLSAMQWFCIELFVGVAALQVVQLRKVAATV